jgi:signal transduction histidine kinase
MLSVIARLPQISIGAEACRLPLTESTAAVLLAALVEPERKDTHALLAEALALDPALALWSAYHHARSTPNDEVIPTIADLAHWLGANISTLVRPATDGGELDEGSSAKMPTRASLSKLAAADVAAAENVASVANLQSDPRYFAALLCHSVLEWLAAGGCPAAAPADLSGWLKHCMSAEDSTESRGGKVFDHKQKTNARPARQGSPQKAAAYASKRNSRAETARQRWLEPPGFASRFFIPLASRLAQLAELECRFDRRLEEEKLEALAEFAAGAGHEINNPLAVISGRAQLFLRHEQDPERRRDLAVINSQARRVHEMIADLMLFARPPEPRLSQCDLAVVINELVAELADRAAERDVELSVRIPPDISRVSADATQLQVAMRAVCDNALNALDSGGRIEIELYEVLSGTKRQGEVGKPLPIKGEGARYGAIAIRDNGPGMSPEVRRHAFDPFFSGRGAGRGLGNGLSKCWRIVTGHGGSVDIDSTPAGTTVTMLLPTTLNTATTAHRAEMRDA